MLLHDCTDDVRSTPATVELFVAAAKKLFTPEYFDRLRMKQDEHNRMLRHMLSGEIKL